MNEEQQKPQVQYAYDCDIIETDSGPIDEGKLRGFRAHVLIPNASLAARPEVGLFQ